MENIKLLRRKQIIWTNLSVIIVFIFFFMFISFVKSMFYYYLLISTFLFISAIFIFISVKYNYSLFEWSRKLQAYEKEKLGKGWVRSRYIASIYTFLMAIYFIWQAYGTRTYQPDFNPDHIFKSMFIVIGITVLVVLNISLFSHIKKIDRTPTVQKGYYWKQIGLGLVLGLVICIILFGYIFYYILEI